MVYEFADAAKDFNYTRKPFSKNIKSPKDMMWIIHFAAQKIEISINKLLILEENVSDFA